MGIIRVQVVYRPTMKMADQGITTMVNVQTLPNKPPQDNQGGQHPPVEFYVSCLEQLLNLPARKKFLIKLSSSSVVGLVRFDFD